MIIFLNTQIATSVTNIDPLEGHAVVDIILGWCTVAEFPCRLTTLTYIPEDEALGTAVDMTFDATSLTVVVALDKQLAALFLVDGEVTLFRAKRECGLYLQLREKIYVSLMICCIKYCGDLPGSKDAHPPSAAYARIPFGCICHWARAWHNDKQIPDRRYHWGIGTSRRSDSNSHSRFQCTDRIHRTILDAGGNLTGKQTNFDLG